MSLFNKKEDVSDEHIDKLLSIFKRIHEASIWTRVDRDDFTIQRFETGYVNDICACFLTEDAKQRLQPRETDPVGIVVKIFSENTVFPLDPVDRGVISTLISVHKLGPKMIYIDSECVINEFIPGCRHYEQVDDQDADFVRKVMCTLARYHCLEAPVRDIYESAWVKRFETLINQIPGATDVFNGNFLKLLDQRPQVAEYQETYSGIDYKAEFDYYRAALKQFAANKVFGHMDFHRGNRLVSERKLSNGETVKELYLVDLDSTMYAPRSYDLSAFFDSYLQKDPMFKRDGFPSDGQIKELLEVYRHECARLVGDSYLEDENNSTERLLREIKLYALNYMLGFVFFSLTLFCANPDQEKTQQIVRDASTRILLYKQLKVQFKQEGDILPDVQ